MDIFKNFPEENPKKINFWYHWFFIPLIIFFLMALYDNTHAGYILNQTVQDAGTFGNTYDTETIVQTFATGTVYGNVRLIEIRGFNSGATTTLNSTSIACNDGTPSEAAALASFYSPGATTSIYLIFPNGFNANECAGENVKLTIGHNGGSPWRAVGSSADTHVGGSCVVNDPSVFCEPVQDLYFRVFADDASSSVIEMLTPRRFDEYATGEGVEFCARYKSDITVGMHVHANRLGATTTDDVLDMERTTLYNPTDEWVTECFPLFYFDDGQYSAEMWLFNVNDAIVSQSPNRIFYVGDGLGNIATSTEFDIRFDCTAELYAYWPGAATSSFFSVTPICDLGKPLVDLILGPIANLFSTFDEYITRDQATSTGKRLGQTISLGFIYMMDVGEYVGVDEDFSIAISALWFVVILSLIVGAIRKIYKLYTLR